MEKEYYESLREKNKECFEKHPKFFKMVVDRTSIMTKILTPYLDKLKSEINTDKKVGLIGMGVDLTSIIIYLCNDFDEALKVCNEIKESVIMQEKGFIRKNDEKNI